MREGGSSEEEEGSSEERREGERCRFHVKMNLGISHKSFYYHPYASL